VLTEAKQLKWERERDIMMKKLVKNPKKLRGWELKTMSPTVRGSFMEKRHLRIHSSFIRKVSPRIKRGDFISEKAGQYYEYKFSLTDANRKTCFLQIRLFQNVDYVFEVFDSRAKVFYSFLIQHKDMMVLVKEHGSPTHASTDKMYSLRCDLSPGRKGNRLWKVFVDKFLVTDEELRNRYRSSQ